MQQHEPSQDPPHQTPGDNVPPSGHDGAPPPASGEYAIPYRPEMSGLALASVILGALSFMGLLLFGSIPAVILGHMARGEIRRSQGRKEGDGMAVAGLILGYANIALHVLGCVVGMLIMALFVTTVRMDTLESSEQHSDWENPPQMIEWEFEEDAR